MRAERSDFDAFVAFHSLKPFEHSDPSKQLNPDVCGNPQTVAYLAEQGVGSFFVPKTNCKELDGVLPYAVGRFASSDTQTVHMSPINTELHMGERGGITAIRSRIASVARLQDVVPVVNGQRVRSIGKDKWRQYQLFGQYMAPTVCTQPGQEVNDAYADFNGGEVYVKGTRGKASETVVRASKETAAATIAAMRTKRAMKGLADMAWLVQEVDVGQPWPEVRGTTEADQSIIDTASPDGNIELRLYYFATKQNLRPHPLYRINAGQEGDDWASIDIETVPAKAYALGDTIVRSVLDIAGCEGALVVVDEYMTADGDIRIRELNSCDPDLEESTPDPNSGIIRFKLLADQLAELAVHKRDTVEA